MKITFGRIFEQSLVGDTKSFEELRPFIEWVQQAVDNTARALTSALTFEDNIDSQYSTQTFRGNAVSQSVEFKLKKNPKCVLLAQQSPVSPAAESFTWQLLTNGNVQANIVFSSAPTNGVTVTLLAIF